MAKGLLKYNYPQIVFAKQIASLLKSNSSSIIIDCPCGNGETSYNLQKFSHAKVKAFDISDTSIAIAKQNFISGRLSYEVSTIENVLDKEKKFDTFCIINSLFLLENYDFILRSLQASARQNKADVFIIIPNTEGNNFKWFQAKNANENKLILKEGEIESFFAKYEFKTKLVKPICFAHHYGRKDVKLFSVFWSFYLGFLNRIQTLFKIGKANYFLIALTS
jgi:2-polyprenyl-3-methyl-5-hydroxy-6-metoxy-1,4-benzoquinol methylase